MATQVKSKSKANKNGRQKVKSPKDSLGGLRQLPTPKREIDPKNLEAIKLLDSWDNFSPEEIQEQKETWAFLKKALDEDRLSPNRPRFPSEEDAS